MTQTVVRKKSKQHSRKLKRATKVSLSRTRRPEGMSLEDWQVALRREYGREQAFEVVNKGNEAVFSDYTVTNPQSKRTYRVAIRGARLGESRCSCPDFAVNTLGTCKHIEFVLERIRRRRGGKLALKRGWHPPQSEVWLQHGARRRVAFRLGTETPSPVRDMAARFFNTEGILRPDMEADFDAFLREAGEHVVCDDDALDVIARLRDARHRKNVMAEKYGDDESLQTLLSTRLYPYQCEGVRFAAVAGRALLGDEMGLGKTLQAMALAELMAREFGVERVLVVCPASLKHQWQSEIEKFTTRPTTVVEGLTHQRAVGYEQRSFFTVVNYDVLHRDLESIERLDPDLVILDEAQRIKNWRTRAANAVKSIKSPYALVLTGTPLENRLEELYSLVQFVDQQRLGALFRFIHNHQETDGTSRVVGYQNLRQIGETLRPVLLRRRKREVMEQLPSRTDKTFFVPMTDPQRNFHEENREIVARLVAKWRKTHFLTESEQRRLTIALQRMRMSCDDAWLVDGVTRAGRKVAELETLLAELLEDSAVRVVIFSQWARMHDLVRDMLNERGWGHAYLHGGVPTRDRKALVARFKQPDTRVFLSTDAGGTGLNLQHASVVVNLDLPWNPAVLEQRIGRVHRIGQTRNVMVVNFVSEGTIEQGMLRLLGFKQSLFAGVLENGEDNIRLDGSALTRFMQTVESVQGATPEAPASEEPDLAAAAAEVPFVPASAEVAAAPAVAEDTPAPEVHAVAGVPKAPATAADRGFANPDPRHDHGPSTAASGDLASLLQAGAALMQSLGQAMAQGTSARRTSTSDMPSDRASVSVERDDATGEVSLRIPLPSPDVVARLAEAAAPLLELLRQAVAPRT